MSYITRTAALVTVAVAIVLCLTSSQAGTIRAYIAGPVVIGGQVFSGGAIELSRLGRSDLVAIKVNGRQVALAFRESSAADAPNGRTHLVLQRDDRGLQHLVGFRAASSDFVPLRFAAVSHGIASAPPAGYARGEGIARATPASTK